MPHVTRTDRVLVSLALGEHPDREDVVDTHDPEQIDSAVAAAPNYLHMREAKAEQNKARQPFERDGVHSLDDVEQRVLPAVTQKLVQLVGQAEQLDDLLDQLIVVRGAVELAQSAHDRPDKSLCFGSSAGAGLSMRSAPRCPQLLRKSIRRGQCIL